MARGICGKVCYRTRDDAERALAVVRSWSDVVRPETLHVYFCPECWSWHVGHDVLPSYNQRRIA